MQPLMDPVVSRAGDRRWGAALVLVTAPLLIAIGVAMWRAPFPISETVGLIENAESVPPLKFFDPTWHSWYRPLYHLTWWTFLQVTRSLGSALTLFKGLEVAATATTVLLFIAILKPRRATEWAAGAFSVAVLVGAPGFRENLEIPMLMTLVGMPLALIVWLLLEREPRAWHGPVIVVLTFIAIGYKEQGLVIVPVVVGAWWMGAPGIRRTTVAVLVVLTLAYLGFRFSYAGTWAPFEQDVGYGFTSLSTRDALTRFGHARLQIYAYSAAATAANILFSEPTDGRFVIVYDYLRGRLAPWEINHLLSSAVLTGLITWWGIGVLRRDWRRGWTMESRVFAATVLAVAASGALGFNYSRDRLGGMAVVFYALAAYHAVRAAADRGRQASLVWVAVVGVLFLLLGAGWQLRAIDTLREVGIRAEKDHRGWVVGLHGRRVEYADRPVYLGILNMMAKPGLDPAGGQRTVYPWWIEAVFAAR